MSTELGFVIAIDGPGGSGKTHLANEVADFYGADRETQIIHTDHYFEPAGTNGVEAVAGLPGGFNTARFMMQVGAALKDPEHPLIVEEYDWETGTYKERKAPDRSQLIVVEGIKLIGLKDIDWDVAVWVHTPRTLRQKRFLERQVAARRMKETDPVALLERFNLWADDAEDYEKNVVRPKGRDVLTVLGDHPAHEALEKIDHTLVYGKGSWQA